jgi:hypothetical protein
MILPFQASPSHVPILGATTTGDGARVPVRQLKGVAHFGHQLELRDGQLRTWQRLRCGGWHSLKTTKGSPKQKMASPCKT